MDKASSVRLPLESRCSEMEALENYLILCKVCQHLSLFDLKNFRLVNKSWEVATTSTLIRRRLWKLTINSKFRQRHNNATLNDLNKCIGNSRMFPLSSLEFSTDNWNLNRSKYIEFFTTMGNNIRRLTLYNSIMSLESFQQLIFELLPNLEYLDLDYISVHSEKKPISEGLFNCSNCFPKPLPVLKIVRFQSIQLNIMRGLLRAAVNLEIIEDAEHDRSILEVIVETNRLRAIKELHFIVSHHTNEEMKNGFYSTLAQLPTQLEAIYLYHNPCEMEPVSMAVPFSASLCLSKIIESCKSSLKKLCSPSCLYLMGVEVPMLPNLKCLQLLETTSFVPEIPYPKGSFVVDKVPKLETIILQQNHLDESCWKKYFPSDNVLQIIPTVKNVTIYGSVDKLSVGAIGLKFPHVTCIKLAHFGDFPLNSLIWTLPPSVTSLELCKFEIKVGVAESFDSFFIGIPENVCKQLKTKNISSQNGIRAVVNELNLLKVKPSVSDMSSLKWLTIVFNHKSNIEWMVPLCQHCKRLERCVQPEVSDVISNLTGLLGFALVPSLQVFFAFDHNRPNSSDIATALKPMKPFVTFIHESGLDNAETVF